MFGVLLMFCVVEPLVRIDGSCLGDPVAFDLCSEVPTKGSERHFERVVELDGACRIASRLLAFLIVKLLLA